VAWSMPPTTTCRAPLSGATRVAFTVPGAPASCGGLDRFCVLPPPFPRAPTPHLPHTPPPPLYPTPPFTCRYWGAVDNIGAGRASAACTRYATIASVGDLRCFSRAAYVAPSAAPVFERRAWRNDGRGGGSAANLSAAFGRLPAGNGRLTLLWRYRFPSRRIFARYISGVVVPPRPLFFTTPTAAFWRHV
jgi:hypothetical protein